MCQKKTLSRCSFHTALSLDPCHDQELDNFCYAGMVINPLGIHIPITRIPNILYIIYIYIDQYRMDDHKPGFEARPRAGWMPTKPMWEPAPKQTSVGTGSGPRAWGPEGRCFTVSTQVPPFRPFLTRSRTCMRMNQKESTINDRDCILIIFDFRCF